MPNSYLVQITSQVADNGVLVPHDYVARRFRRSDHPESGHSRGSLYYDETNSKLVKNAVKPRTKVR